MMDWWKERDCFMARLAKMKPERPVSLRTTTQHQKFALAYRPGAEKTYQLA
jgi:hypothetical protein